MKIYFTFSTQKFLKFKDNYFAIRNYLIKKGHVLTRDWMPHTYKKIKDNKYEINNIKEIYQVCMKAINQADLVIIEDSISNFSTGHQITIALQRRKPTLVLTSIPKHRHFSQTFIQGIASEFLEVKEYNLDNYKEIINEFIKKYEHIKDTNRFNLVLTGVERDYLDWAHLSKHKSRTNIIKEILREKTNNDTEYSNYLKTIK